MSVSDEIAIFAAKIGLVLGFVVLCGAFCMCSSCGGKSKKGASDSKYFTMKKYELVPTFEFSDGKVQVLVEPASRTRKPQALTYDFDIEKPDELQKFVQLAVAITPAIVTFRIDSPGGSASAFSAAYASIRRLESRGIKTVALIDGCALSGGYMAACACQEIVASPSAQVGSIGVILQTISIRDLLERFGVKPVYMTTTNHKGLGGPLDRITPEREEALRTELGYTYDHFKSIVLGARGAKITNQDEVFSARAWYVSSAPAGLVDIVSTGDDYLLELSKTHDILVVERNDEKSRLDKLFESLDIRSHIKNLSVPRLVA